MKRFLTKKYLIIGAIVILLALSVRFHTIFEGEAVSAKTSAVAVSDKNLPTFTPDSLKKYNGTDPDLPIYLVLDGNVYDVTGGPYHYLAGKDSSFELHMVGGDIIKRKYPIIGRYKDI